MALGGESLWCGASLRPWQILHSRLARMHTCALLERDVWELMDETVEAAAYPLSKCEESPQILDGYDGELWRHGGLMEARIRDWLTSKIEQESREAPTILHPYNHNDCTSDTSSSEFSDACRGTFEEHVEGDIDYSSPEEDTEDGGDYSYNSTNTIATCSDEFSGAWDSRYIEEAVYVAVAGVLDSGIYEEGDEDEVEVKEDQSCIGSNVANAAAEHVANAAACSAAPLDAATYYNRQVTEDAQTTTEHEEDEPLCAVCLEKLYIDEETQGFRINGITHLPCHHSFHSQCLSPWLSASSMCPCCRAAIGPLHLEAPLNLGAGSGGANCSDRVQRDMMGLIAEVEAALDLFGLLL